MTPDQFQTELLWLAAQFEKAISPDLEKALWQELKGHDARDWGEAVRTIARRPEQRTWPRLGQLLEAINAAGLDRKEVEWAKEKAAEAAAVKAIMTGEARTEAAKKVRRIVEAMGKGKAAVDALEAEFRHDAVDAGAYDQLTCSCEEGYVFVKEPHGSPDAVLHVGVCEVCDLGRKPPKWRHRLDPVTGRRL